RKQDPLVSAEWLKQKAGAPDLRIVDATWFLPIEPYDARDEFNRAHIPDAFFFDIDEIADTDNPLPHMLPSPEKFASRMRKAGIGDGATIIVYDARGLFSAARVWWTFRVMGVEEVYVLDGGLPAWIAAGGEVEDGPPPRRQERHFTARYNAALVRNFDDMVKLVENGGAQIFDARPRGRFIGSEPEPRQGLRSGRMPGAVNLPPAMLFEKDGRMKSRAALAGLFSDLGVEPGKPIVCTCGSGVSAATLALAFARIGKWDVPVYDGSWTEWGAKPDVPVVSGPI
ncbi:MAG: 3-mercaptopyruvate sulfurtransferase, partial [Hyphomonadaceae bacterium]